MNAISNQDLLMFFLVAIITLSLQVFTGGVQGHISNIELSSQAAQVLSAVQGGNPPVILTVNPGILKRNTAGVISWNIATNNLSSCVASSNPLDANWSGDKNAKQGIHTEKTSALQTSTEYTIECVSTEGKTSV